MIKAERDLLAIRLASDAFLSVAFSRNLKWDLSMMPGIIKTRVELAANAHGIPEKHYSSMIEVAVQHYNHFLRDPLTVLVDFKESSG
jgi:hypothetical protein